MFAFQIFSSGTAFGLAVSVIGDQALVSNQNLPGFVPTAPSDEIIISRKQYVLSYNKTRREPNWVAWKIEESDFGSSGRSPFIVDTELEDYLGKLPNPLPAVKPTDYQGSCFDRGHQAPSGDRTLSTEDNQATFVMSNMIPQTAYLNRVIWEHLEAHSRDLVHQGKILYVVAGPVYDQDYGAIGPNHDIPVPSKDFKLIFVLEAGQTARDITASTPVISVLMPNILEDGSAPTGQSARCPSSDASKFLSNDWEKYQTPLSEIERISGISLH